MLDHNVETWPWNAMSDCCTSPSLYKRALWVYLGHWHGGRDSKAGPGSALGLLRLLTTSNINCWHVLTYSSCCSQVPQIAHFSANKFLTSDHLALKEDKSNYLILWEPAAHWAWPKLVQLFMCTTSGKCSYIRYWRVYSHSGLIIWTSHVHKACYCWYMVQM